MMSAVTVVLATLLAAQPVSQAAAPAPSTPAPVPAAEKPAIDTILAATMQPATIVASVLQGFDAGFDAQLQRMPNYAELGQRYPGIWADLKAATRTEVAKLATASMPELQSRVAGFYVQTFTASELQTLADFYRTPTGQRMLAGAQRGARDKAIAAVKAGDAKTADLNEVMNGASAGALSQVQPDDMPVLLAFSATPAAQRAKTAAPQLQQLTIGWMRQLMAGNEQRIASLTADTMKRYMAAHPPKPAS